MSRNTFAISALPPSSLSRLKDLGHRIRLARKRRKLTLRQLADLMLVSVATLQRLEKGAPGVSLGTLMTALTCLQLENDIDAVAAMETDKVGLEYERRRLEGLNRRQSGPAKENIYNF